MLDQDLRVLIMGPSKRTHAMAGERSQPVRRQRAKAQAASTVAPKTQAAATAAAAAAAKTQSAATADTAAVATPNPKRWARAVLDPKADACLVAAVGPMVLSIGSDCSGWCTELQAARAVCPFPVRQVLACDSAAYVRRLIQHCIKPTCLFDGLRTRGFDQTQHLDIYSCGWPCQAFSRNGLMQGMADSKGRGALIMNVIAFIEATLPTSFILETCQRWCLTSRMSLKLS